MNNINQPAPASTGITISESAERALNALEVAQKLLSGSHPDIGPTKGARDVVLELVTDCAEELRGALKVKATPPAAPAESVTELCANHDNLREYISQLERERDEAKARAIQAWKDADAAIVKEVESRVASIMGSPDNEIARLTASKNVFRDERDALQDERNTLRSQLAHARSRGDDKEIAEKERDAARAELEEAMKERDATKDLLTEACVALTAIFELTLQAGDNTWYIRNHARNAKASIDTAIPKQ